MSQHGEHDEYRPVPPRQDNHGPIEFGARLADDIVMALRFFSRLPTGDRPHELPNLSRIALALPFASVLIGFVPVLVLMGTNDPDFPEPGAEARAARRQLAVAEARMVADSGHYPHADQPDATAADLVEFLAVTARA